MDRLEMRTEDLSQEKIRMLRELFPNCITETIVERGDVKKIVLSVDFDSLKQELSDQAIEGPRERYMFTWPNKAASRAFANAPTSKTLRPYKDESVDFDNTKNIYIEGDNLEVLKILRETYKNKVKMIYIDPPYNTGNDFVYSDDFSMSKEEYSQISGDYSESGCRLFLNTTSNGRFHTDWLSRLYPTLLLSRYFLRDDGIIFISIDDNEVANLRKICDEIFGESNFIAQMVIEGTPKNDPLIISTAHEYCLVYVKDMSVAKTKEWGVKNPLYSELMELYRQYNPDYSGLVAALKRFYADNDLTSENISNYKYADKNGIYRIGPIDDPQGAGPKDQRVNPKTGAYCQIPSRGWSCTEKTWNEWVSNNLIEFPDDDSKLPSKKTYISTDKLDVLRAYFKIQTRKDTDMLKTMFGGKKVFLFPKPLEFIRKLIEATTAEGDLVMDFFSGSATTAHAVLELSQTTGISRNFILVQLPEEFEKTLEQTSGNRSKQSLKDAISYCREKGVPANICEIAKERIRLVGKQLKQRIDTQALVGSPF